MKPAYSVLRNRVHFTSCKVLDRIYGWLGCLTTMNIVFSETSIDGIRKGINRNLTACLLQMITIHILETTFIKDSYTECNKILIPNHLYLITSNRTQPHDSRVVSNSPK